MITEELPETQETDFDNAHHHIAEGPPYITTLCGINVRGQLPKETVTKPECPICKALENEIHQNKNT